jgi:hypothetical protein
MRPRGVAPFTIAGRRRLLRHRPRRAGARDARGSHPLARLLALATLAERDVTVDAAAIAAALVGIREQLELVRQLKSQLTSISTATKTVWTGLDEMRAAILTRVTEAEAEIRYGGELNADSVRGNRRPGSDALASRHRDHRTLRTTWHVREDRDESRPITALGEWLPPGTHRVRRSDCAESVPLPLPR